MASNRSNCPPPPPRCERQCSTMFNKCTSKLGQLGSLMVTQPGFDWFLGIFRRLWSKLSVPQKWKIVPKHSNMLIGLNEAIRSTQWWKISKKGSELCEAIPSLNWHNSTEGRPLPCCNAINNWLAILFTKCATNKSHVEVKLPDFFHWGRAESDI